MFVWLKKAPECIFCSCEKSCFAAKGISIYISTGFQVRKIQSELRLSFYSTTYHSSPICPHSTSTFSLFLFCHSQAQDLKWKIFLTLTNCCVKVPSRIRQEFQITLSKTQQWASPSQLYFSSCSTAGDQRAAPVAPLSNAASSSLLWRVNESKYAAPRTKKQ